MSGSWLRRMGCKDVYALGGGGLTAAPTLQTGDYVLADQDTGSPVDWTQAQQREYLRGETGLIEQIACDGTLEFPP